MPSYVAIIESPPRPECHTRQMSFVGVPGLVSPQRCSICEIFEADDDWVALGIAHNLAGDVRGKATQLLRVSCKVDLNLKVPLLVEC